MVILDRKVLPGHPDRPVRRGQRGQADLVDEEATTENMATTEKPVILETRATTGKQELQDRPGSRVLKGLRE